MSRFSEPRSSPSAAPGRAPVALKKAAPAWRSYSARTPPFGKPEVGPILEREGSGNAPNAMLWSLSDFSIFPSETSAPQPMLKVGTPDDIYEWEADRAADRVMEVLSPAASRSGGSASPPQIRRIRPAQEPLQREINPPAGVLPGYEQAVGQVQGGKPLSLSERAFFEPRLGADFSAVRIHDDARADTAANALGARAYTLGTDIVFGSGNYDPASTQGKRLMAHELAHVIQQGAQPSPSSRIQRAMKFEYQVKNGANVTNLLFRDNGSTVETLPRKYGPEDYLVKGTSGVRLESETHGQPEFETGWEKKWSKLNAQISEAQFMCARMGAAKEVTGSDGNVYKEFPFTGKFPFTGTDIAHLGPGQAFATKGTTWSKTQNTEKRVVFSKNKKLKVRSSPGVPAPKEPGTTIGELNHGDQLKVLDTSGPWYRIEHDGLKGWVHGPKTRILQKRYESNGNDTILQSTERILMRIVDNDWTAYIQVSESFGLDQFESYLTQMDNQGVASGVVNESKDFVEKFNPDQAVAGESWWSEMRREHRFLAKNPGLTNFLMMVGYYIKMGAANPATHVDGSRGPAKWAFPLMSRTNFGSIHASLQQKEKDLFEQMVRDEVKGILPTMGLTRSDKLLVSGHGGGSGPTVYGWLIGITQGVDKLSGKGFPGAMGKFRIENEIDKNKALIRFEGRRTSGNSQKAANWTTHALEHFTKAATLRARLQGKGKTGLKP